MRRLDRGGQIDRRTILRFTFDGASLTGYAGDTIASALLAQGRHLVARSVKYHRPRGILSAGPEEPSAMVSVTDASGPRPNLKATEVPLEDGMAVTSQNAFPSLEQDRAALIGLGQRALGAGFYYKTFMWPRGGWHRRYAPRIRQLAGHGRVDATGDPAAYDQRRLHCDLLVIGSGAAGLSAAVTAAQAGATTVLLEQDHAIGGGLLAEAGTIGGVKAAEWAAEMHAALSELSNVVILERTQAFGQYDHGLVQAVETCPPHASARAVHWKIRARRILLAAGAIERPVVFPGNDRPGIMLAGAVRSYIRRFAVVPGYRAAMAISDPGERADTAEALRTAGIEVVGTLEPGDRIIGTTGRLHLSGLRWRDETNRRRRVSCDLLCVSGGWTPTAHLSAHLGDRLPVDPDAGTPMPGLVSGILRPAGGARGVYDIADCISDGKAAAHEAMAELEMHKHLGLSRPPIRKNDATAFLSDTGTAFVDLQNDVTRNDIGLALREGYDDVELIKRYTTLGMGTDQGKTSWSNGIAEIARVSGRATAEIGHTTYRPPFSPVPIGALVGARVNEAMAPTRRTPFHDRFARLGCVFQTSGDWDYSRYFPHGDETMDEAVLRECRAVRGSVGCVDMSTLGKFEVRGPGALTFLSRLYCNGFDRLRPGRLRYVLMLREDGYVFDDGTVAQLGEGHYIVTATTARAGSVWRHMKKCAQVHWPELDATLVQVSDHWATLAIAGPEARGVLSHLGPDFEIGSDAFPFARVRTGRTGGDLPVQVCTVGFSGELSYEIATPAGYAGILLDRVMSAEPKVVPYGLEALDVLRIEKGHMSVGTEIDGRRVPDDLGLGGMVSKTKDFLGRALLERPNLQAPGREQLVGLIPKDGGTAIPRGAQLSDHALDPEGRAPLCGHLTAAIHSPTLGHPIALGFLAEGRARMGEVIWAHSPIEGTSAQVRVVSPRHYDPEGRRVHD